MKKYYFIFLATSLVSVIAVYGSSQKLNLSELQMANIELMSKDDGKIGLEICRPYSFAGEPAKEGEKTKNRCKNGTSTTIFVENIPKDSMYPCEAYVYKRLPSVLLPFGYCYVNK